MIISLGLLLVSLWFTMARDLVEKNVCRWKERSDSFPTCLDEQKTRPLANVGCLLSPVDRADPPFSVHWLLGRLLRAEMNAVHVWSYLSQSFHDYAVLSAMVDVDRFSLLIMTFVCGGANLVTHLLTLVFSLSFVCPSWSSRLDFFVAEIVDFLHQSCFFFFFFLWICMTDAILSYANFNDEKPSSSSCRIILAHLVVVIVIWSIHGWFWLKLERFFSCRDLLISIIYFSLATINEQWREFFFPLPSSKTNHSFLG